MDFWKALHELQVEKERLDHVIASLEALLKGAQRENPSRRGRKGMSEEERREVSERMKRYWATRRGPDTMERSTKGISMGAST